MGGKAQRSQRVLSTFQGMHRGRLSNLVGKRAAQELKSIVRNQTRGARTGVSARSGVRMMFERFTEKAIKVSRISSMIVEYFRDLPSVHGARGEYEKFFCGLSFGL